jgi:hypothetical protein
MDGIHICRSKSFLFPTNFEFMLHFTEFRHFNRLLDYINKSAPSLEIISFTATATCILRLAEYLSSTHHTHKVSR